MLTGTNLDLFCNELQEFPKCVITIIIWNSSFGLLDPMLSRLFFTPDKEVLGAFVPPWSAESFRHYFQRESIYLVVLFPTSSVACGCLIPKSVLFFIPLIFLVLSLQVFVLVVYQSITGPARCP